ncbi:MAG: alpha/beta fold hydrolase [Proteobacteria bacterium]|nr:alpha/beta fold hydrolase [Pseudomonadota bacterium]
MAGRTPWVRLELHGDEGKPLLLLVYGMGCTARFWDNLLPDLQQQWRVAVLDWRHAPWWMGLGRICGHAAKHLREQTLEPQVVMGHSLGAGIAYRLAGEFGARALLCAPCGQGHAMLASALWAGGNYAIRPWVWRRPLRLMFCEKGMDKHTLEELLGYAQTLKDQRPERWAHLNDLRRGVMQWKWAWKHPAKTIIIEGEKDRLCWPWEARALRRYLKARLVIVPGGGHLFWWENKRRRAELLAVLQAVGR